MKGIKGIMIGIASLVMLSGTNTFGSERSLEDYIAYGNTRKVKELIAEGLDVNKKYYMVGLLL